MISQLCFHFTSHKELTKTKLQHKCTGLRM